MIHNKISNQMILVSLLFLVSMSQIIDVSAVTSIEFSEEKKAIFFQGEKKLEESG